MCVAVIAPFAGRYGPPNEPGTRRSTNFAPSSVFSVMYACASRGTWYGCWIFSVSLTSRSSSWMSSTLPMTTPRSRTSDPSWSCCPARGSVIVRL
jgi:hypothetical protein